MDQLQRLTDRAEIIERFCNRYAAGMDLLNRPLYESCFTEPVEIDFGSWDADAAKTMSIKEWVDYVWHLIVGLDTTQHIITNHHITFQGDDAATCICYLHAQHYIKGAPTEVFTAGGYYTDRVVRVDGEWKITGCKFTMTWTTGDVGVIELGTTRTPRTTAIRS